MHFRRAALSTTSTRYAEDITKATTHKEAPIVDADVVVSPAEHQQKAKLSGLVSIPVEVNILSIWSNKTVNIWFCSQFRKTFHPSVEFRANTFVPDVFEFLFPQKM